MAFSGCVDQTSMPSWIPGRRSQPNPERKPNMNDFGLLFQDRFAPRWYCTHSATRSVRMPATSRHHARVECADCGAFLKFLARPENIERRKLVGVQLAKLIEHSGLSPWEWQFIGSLAKQGTKLSPKQQEVFDRICAKYLSPSAAEK